MNYLLKSLSLASLVALSASFAHADTLTGRVSFSGANEFVTGSPSGTLTANTAAPTGVVFSYYPAFPGTASTPTSESVVGTVPSGAMVFGLSLNQILQFGQTAVANPTVAGVTEYYFNLTIPTGGEILFTTPTTTFTVTSDLYLAPNTAVNHTPNPTLLLTGYITDSNFPGRQVGVVLNLTDNAGSLGGGLDTDISNLTLTATPEPSSLVLLGTGLASAAGMLSRKRRIKA